MFCPPIRKSDADLVIDRDISHNVPNHELNF